MTPRHRTTNLPRTISLLGLRMALDLLSEENPKAKSAKPEDLVISTTGGDIDNLYKPSPDEPVGRLEHVNS